MAVGCVIAFHHNRCLSLYNSPNQGWEFALWFFVLIALLRAKEQFALFKEQIALAALFKRATGANVVFYKEQEER